MTDIEQNLFSMLMRKESQIERLIAILESKKGIQPQTGKDVEHCGQHSYIKDVIQDYYEYKLAHVKRSSAEAISNMLSRGSCYDEVKDTALSEMDYRWFQRWIDETSLPSRRVMHFVITLRTFLKWARKRGKYIVADDFSDELEYKKDGSERHGGIEISKDDVEKIENNAFEHMDNAGAVATYIAISFGLRIGEVCALTAGDWDRINKTLTINKTKQRVYSAMKAKSEVITGTPKTKGSNRVCPASGRIAEYMDRITHEMEDGLPIIQRVDECVIEPRSVRAWSEKWCKSIGLSRHYSFHSLRHTFVSRHLRNGANPKAISAFVGHSSLNMTLGVYTHVNDDDLRGVMANG